jgi:hypothetical protein
MRKHQTVLFLLFIIVFSAAALSAKNGSMSVQVDKGHLRAAPSFLGKILVTLDYGDRVEVLEQKDLWMKVQALESKATGWIHVSALTSKKILLKAGKEDVEQAATSDELALAGKGFNQEVEKEFKAKNPHLDYTWINEMENMIVSREQMVTFLAEGELTGKEGVK